MLYQHFGHFQCNYVRSRSRTSGKGVHVVCGRVPWLNQSVLARWVYGFVVLCPGAPEGSTGSGSGFKASQKKGQWLKVSSNRLGEAENLTCDSWFTRLRFIPYTTVAHVYKKKWQFALLISSHFS